MDSNTTMFSITMDRENEVRQVLNKVHEALKEKGYNPISQIVGYIMSGDPSYITSHNGARSLISKIERDELLEVVFADYLEGDK
ncbi:MAG: IreB family regulatory phosphoprotein [Bacillota bacterium]|nr:IreB family regulatory phosphoprotein [Bacillota bacterium]